MVSLFQRCDRSDNSEAEIRCELTLQLIMSPAYFALRIIWADPVPFPSIPYIIAALDLLLTYSMHLMVLETSQNQGN